MEKAMAVVVAYGNKVRPWEEFGWLPNRVNEREREKRGKRAPTREEEGKGSKYRRKRSITYCGLGFSACCSVADRPIVGPSIAILPKPKGEPNPKTTIDYDSLELESSLLRLMYLDRLSSDGYTHPQGTNAPKYSYIKK